MIKPERPISGKPIPKGWHAALWDWVQSMDISGDMKTIFVKESSSGKMISGKPFSSSPGGGGGGSSKYSGPFAVAKLTDTSAEVLGYSVADKQYWNNYIICGLSRIEVADGANVTGITSSGYLYIGITWNGSTYVATLAHAAALPAQDATHIYVPLAYILCASSIISSITQIQYGIIHYPARAG